MSLWIAELVISDRTAEKIRRKHHLEPDDVRDALVGVTGLRYVIAGQPEPSHPIVEFTLKGQRVLAVIYPRTSAMGDAWNLASAYPVG